MEGLLPNNVHLLLSEGGGVDGESVSFGNGHCKFCMTLNVSSGDEKNRLKASLFILFPTMWTVQKLNGWLEREIVNVQPE